MQHLLPLFKQNKIDLNVQNWFSFLPTLLKGWITRINPIQTLAFFSDLQNQKLCSILPSSENEKLPTCWINWQTYKTHIGTIQSHHNQDEKNTLLALPDDIPYLHRSIKNLRYHQSIDVKVLRQHQESVSNKHFHEKKTASVIMDKIKYMLNYKVG